MKRLILAALCALAAGCIKVPTDIHTQNDVAGPTCPWPPPTVTDTIPSGLPLGCPYIDQDGKLVHWGR